MLENLTKPVIRYTCKLGTYLARLEANDQKKLNEALADTDWPSVTLARQLTELGLPMSGHVVAHHRKRVCACWKN